MGLPIQSGRDKWALMMTASPLVVLVIVVLGVTVGRLLNPNPKSDPGPAGALLVLLPIVTILGSFAAPFVATSFRARNWAITASAANFLLLVVFFVIIIIAS